MSVAAHCTNLESIAGFLGFAPQHLYYLVELRDKLYVKVQIPKKSGGATRTLYIPRPDLKGVQRAILTEILSEFSESRHAYAYCKGRSAFDAASRLSGDQSVLRVDIENFFPSIADKRIFGFFKKKGFNGKSSFILTQLLTYNGSLTQGSPASPKLSNLICDNLDRSLAKLSTAWGLGYLRYSDDLFFHGPQNFKYRRFVGYCGRILSSNGFALNRRKTRYHPVGKPRYTLGLATHGKRPRLTRESRRTLRAAFYKASRNINWAQDNLDKLRGLAEWHKVVNGSDEAYKEYRKILQNVEKMMLHDTYLV